MGPVKGLCIGLAAIGGILFPPTNIGPEYLAKRESYNLISSYLEGKEIARIPIDTKHFKFTSVIRYGKNLRPEVTIEFPGIENLEKSLKENIVLQKVDSQKNLEAISGFKQ